MLTYRVIITHKYIGMNEIEQLTYSADHMSDRIETIVNFA